MRRLGATVAALTLVFLAPQAAAHHRHSWPGRAHYHVPLKKMDRALACHDGKRNLDGHGRGQPVLLVPGTGASREENWQWNYWNQLPRVKFEVCWVNLPSRSLADIQRASEYVARAVQVMHRRSGEKIDILGHSQGGLQPRWAIRWFPSGRLVDDYFGVASPNHGTVVADAGDPCSPACWQMKTSSRFIAALNFWDETPGPVSYSDIYTRNDQLVQPQTPGNETSALMGPETKTLNVAVQDICPERTDDHVTVVADIITYKLVVNAFTHRGPATLSSLPDDICTRDPRMPGATSPPPDLATDLSDYAGGQPTDHEPRLKWYARRHRDR